MDGWMDGCMEGADGQGAWRRLREETTCSLCRDLFSAPVTLGCGHHFCRGCLGQGWRAAPLCPRCGERVAPAWEENRLLATFAAIARRVSAEEAEEAGAAAGGCPRHREPLKLFCKDDGAPLCVVCGLSREHRGHAVVPADEAAQDYKEEFCSRLADLRKERGDILACKRDTEQESQVWLKVTSSEREKTLAEFRKLHQFLEEQEQLLLGQMEKVEREITRERDECLARLSEELSSLEGLIQEMEEKVQQPVRDFLKEFRSTLQICEKKKKFEAPVAFTPELKWKIWDFCDLSSFLEGVLEEFKGILESGFQQQVATVTLDPDTAHPQLSLSEDRKSMARGDKYQDLPDSPERFDKHCMVLGCERFSLGRHRWEVTVGSEEGWAVGVARMSVSRKGKFTASPEGGIWAIRTWKGAYKAFVPSLPSPLSFSGVLRKIRVCLNGAGGQVAFFDANTATPLYTFSGISSGEALQPFFWVYEKGCLTVSP
ncbi:E3 ubiquitin-protein ligase TRIM7-like [Paroedura picta]|uniref:E3 ubiquitin-protein ligase TRIM7-like n=1 Tax=Paroedura picta TaxID=143630 RepID=UPI004056FD6F